MWKFQKDTGDFRLVDRKVVEVINSLPEHNKFLRGLFSWVGFEQKAFEYERKERFAGKTKYPLKKMLKLASDGIIGFSTKPLKNSRWAWNVNNFYICYHFNLFFIIFYL